MSITTQPSFSFGNQVSIPRGFALFNAPTDVRSHDISTDGRRFIGLVDGSAAGSAGVNTAPQMQVVLNWFEALKQRVPIK